MNPEITVLLTSFGKMFFFHLAFILNENILF